MELPDTIPTEPVLKTLDEMDVIGLSTRVTYGNNTIPQLWEKLIDVEQQIPHKTPISVGICVMDEDPTSKEFTAIAGHVVSHVEAIPEGFVHFQVPAGEYLVFTHRGPLPTTLSKTYHYIYEDYFPQSRYEPTMEFDFEWYEHPRFKGVMDPETEIDIYIPVLTK
ncbi:MAG: GyrI-like domain-containing protein [bacterium]|nr:GyrI-like domain-containing protein [bacterium]